MTDLRIEHMRLVEIEGIYTVRTFGALLATLVLIALWLIFAPRDNALVGALLLIPVFIAVGSFVYHLHKTQRVLHTKDHVTRQLLYGRR